MNIKNEHSTRSFDLSLYISFLDRLVSSACSLYDSMMKNTIIITNSEFSKRAIQQLYGDTVKVIILSPPVDVNTFRRQALYLRKGQRKSTILVVSRFSPDKKIENAIKIAHILNHKRINNKMVIVGNISDDDHDYFEFLDSMINQYSLKNKVKLEIGVSFVRLLYLMRESQIYLHPLAGEPFGISVAEAMAAGLIPVVPSVGGNSEFVPARYHYNTLEEAADIIERELWVHDMNYNGNLDNQIRTNLSNLTLKFSTDKYKERLKKIIGSLVTIREKETPLLLDHHH